MYQSKKSEMPLLGNGTLVFESYTTVRDEFKYNNKTQRKVNSIEANGTIAIISR